MRPLPWYIARLRAMSPPEILYRITQSARKRSRRHARSDHQLPGLATDLLASLPPLNEPREIPIFDLLLPYSSSAPINWSRDYKNGLDAPLQFYGDLDYRDESAVGDIKYTWELNRHQFLVPWARNYARRKNPDDATAVARVILEWIRDNPQYHGINWTSSLELALRILSWGIAFDLCRDAPAIVQALPIVQQSVAQQARYIRTTLSLYSSANNHLMGELVGLLAAGVYFPEAHGARNHAEFAWRMIQEEARRQNTDDGANREQAIYYHHYVLEYMLTAAALARRAGFSIPDSFLQLCHRMTAFLHLMTDDEGNPYEIGDRDDGMATGFNLGSDVSVFESLLWSGWRVFGIDEFGRHAAVIAMARGMEPPAPDPRTVYWCGDENWEPPSSAPTAPPSASVNKNKMRIFRDGGYAFGDWDRFSFVFRAGPFGYPQIAAHAHCDQLSLCVRGHDASSRAGRTKPFEVLTDSGTYCYHTDEKWRRYFRGTSAHNTIRIDGLDQAEYAGPFLWSSHADGEIVSVDEHADGSTVQASTRCWKHRLGIDVTHQRAVRLTAAGLIITDTLGTSPRSHNFELFWNFGPQIALETHDIPPLESTISHWMAWKILHLGAHILTLWIASKSPVAAVLHCGNEEIPAGFYSRHFLVKEPIPQLCVTATGNAWTVRTFILLPGSMPFGTQ